MTLDIKFHPDATNELEEAVGWYEIRREGLGRELKDLVEEALERLATGLLNGTEARGRLARLGVRRLVLTRFPYDIVFRRRDEKLLVVAVSHHSRRPGYWRERLRTRPK